MWQRKKCYKIVVVLSLVSVCVCLMYGICFWIGERFFFDKLFYYKSTLFGYWIPGKSLQLSDFGERSRDMVSLLANQHRNSQEPSNEYTIAVIGDSEAWGQGVLVRERMSALLEQKLKRYRRTHVFTFANCGDSAIDNYAKYDLIQRKYNIDLFIFVLVDNDLMYNKKERYPASSIYRKITAGCSGIDGIDGMTYYSPDISDLYQLQLESYRNPNNICAIQLTASMYPKTNAIYYINRDLWGSDSKDYCATTRAYQGYLEQNGLHVISMSRSKQMTQYDWFWKSPYKYSSISLLEGHPSKIIHQIGADILSEEIVSNPKWNFMSK